MQSSTLHLGQVETPFALALNGILALTYFYVIYFHSFPLLLLSISHHFRIGPVSIPYCFRIVSVFRYGIDTGLIRER